MEIREEVHLKVEEKYNPPAHIVERAWIKDYESLYKESISDREGFWAKVGDWVEIVGENQSFTDLAKLAGTIPYELMTNLSSRIRRQVC